MITSFKNIVIQAMIVNTRASASKKGCCYFAFELHRELMGPLYYSTLILKELDDLLDFSVAEKYLLPAQFLS